MNKKMDNHDIIYTLVVEDSSAQAENLRYFLENYGYKVTLTHDAQEALEWIQNTETYPDVIISDVLMPKMDGYEFCKVLRADQRFKKIPVILLTSLSKPRDIIKGIEAGANKFLTKPFDHKRLPKIIDELYINAKRKNSKRMDGGIKLMFEGDDLLITAEKAQILDLLLSSYEESCTKNIQLQEAHNRLERLNQDLEQKVQKRTMQLREKDKLMLMQSRQAAMGSMISMIAHQWRQPLSIISMEINDVKASIELEEEITAEYLQKNYHSIGEQVQLLSQTIDDFRDYFKPDQKKVLTNVADVAQKAISLTRKSMENNNISVVFANNSNSEIELYANQLLQVFLNILNNAKDVFKNRSITNAKVTLSIYDTAESVITTICDNGGGIPKEIIDKVGEPYFTTKDKDGTGLGIYMSKTIVAEHLNGNLKFSNTDKGVCFSVTLKK